MNNTNTYSNNTQKLIDQGVQILLPATVFIADNIDTSKISSSVVIHPGCRISGQNTSIGSGTIIGEEAPVTIDNCQIANNCKLKGGYFKEAVLWNDVEFGSAAHIRPGTILEEKSSCAHSVGLKQTILMPYVTTGSLINFCDCLMSGGTGKDNHSEVGSSYVHFNFTPQQDKATASLIGDVPKGIWLDSPPVFLGGQGGLIGPVVIEYGSVVAAGITTRKNITTPNTIIYGTETNITNAKFDPRVYKSINKKIENCLLYLGNIFALYQWNLNIRPLFTKDDIYLESCRIGAVRCLEIIIQERIKRLNDLYNKVQQSVNILTKNNTAIATALNSQKHFINCWPSIKQELDNYKDNKGNIKQRTLLIESINIKSDYLTTLHNCSTQTKEVGKNWLQSIANKTVALWNINKEHINNE